MMGSFHRLGDLVKARLDRAGLQTAVRERAARWMWPEVVGEKTASVTRVERVMDGVLYVTCRDSIWAQELHFLRPAIIRKLNERLGAELVKEIRLSGVGFKDRGARQEERPPAQNKENAPKLSAGEMEAIERAVGKIDDQSLAGKVRSALEAGRRMRKRRT